MELIIHLIVFIILFPLSLGVIVKSVPSNPQWEEYKTMNKWK